MTSVCKLSSSPLGTGCIFFFLVTGVEHSKSLFTDLKKNENYIYVTPRWGETFSFETRRPVLKLDCTVSKLENGSHTQFWGNVRIRRKSILGYITVTVTVTVWAHSPLYLVAYLILFLPSRHRMLGDQLRSSWEEECWDVIEMWFSCQFYSD